MTPSGDVRFGRFGPALAAAIALAWLAAGWAALDSVPAALCAPAAAALLTASLIGNLVLGRRLMLVRRSERRALERYDVVSAALDAVPVGVQIKDADLRYIWVNSTNESRTDWSAAEMIGRTAEEIGLDPALAAAVTAHDRRVLRSGRTEGPEEQVIKTRDGRLKYITLITKVPLLRDGKVTHIVSIAADLKQWHEAQVRAEEIRRLLETVMDAAPTTMQVADLDQRLRWVNKAYCQHIGWGAGSPVGKTLAETSPYPDQLAEALAANRAILEDGVPVVQLRQTYPATEHLPERHLLLTKVPVRDTHGDVAQILTMGTDVTALIKAEAEASTANRLVEGILRHIPLGLLVKDTELRCRWTNPAFGAMLGRDETEIIGQTIDALDMPEHFRQRSKTVDKSVLATGETFQYHERRVINGVEQDFMTTKAPMLDEAGRATHVITIIADTTELHRLRAEVDEARRRLQAVLDAVPAVIALKDTQRRFAWVNRAFEHVNEFENGTPIGKRSEDFLPDEALAREVRSADEAVLATGTELGPMAQRHRLADGRDRDFTVRRLAVRDASGAIDGILVVAMDVTDLLQTTSELRRMNEELEQRAADRARELAKVNEFVATVVECAPTPVITYHPDSRIRSWNAAAAQLTGFSATEALDTPVAVLFPEHRQQIGETMAMMLGGGSCSNLEIQLKRKDGRTIEMLMSGGPLRLGDGTIDGTVVIWVDVTAQRAAERQLRQAQKMEAIGQLTGNVAHDFNNLLAIVIGNLDLLADIHQADPEACELVSEAIAAAERGAALTGRLLAFARQQTLRPAAVGIGALIGGMRPLLQRAVGETIAIDVSIAKDLWLAKADPNQLESAVLNLSVNARDAMPAGGRLTLAARNATLDAAYVALRTDVAAGDYVCLSVSDTGTGIPPDILGHVFEPFFTTKGKGSGLGLSIVYGFVTQSGGHVTVQSKPGAGTSFSLFLPRVAGAIAPDATGPAPVPGGSASVLVVEDNPQLLRTSASTIQALGHTVMTAGDGAAALAILEAQSGIDLLFTDIVLPGGMNGFELARQAIDLRPALKVVFVSGFVDPALTACQPWRDAAVLTKPFRRSELGARLDAALRGKNPAEAATELT